MRAFGFALALSLLLLAGPAAAAQPTRVASLKLCTDELLMMLADPNRIVSLTYLSQQQAESPLWQQARRHHGNDGSILSVAGLAPDLVIDMGGGARDSERIAGRLGARLLTLPYPQTLGDIEASIREVAAALGRPDRGRYLLNRIKSLRHSAPEASVDSAWLGGGGRSLAATSLGAQWMALAGLRQRSFAGDRLTLEQLLVSPPALLLRSDYRAGQYSAEQKWLAHPLLRKAPRSRSVPTDGRRWTCMGPLMIDEIVRLRVLVRR